MRDTLRKYKRYEGRAITKISQLFLIAIITLLYLFVIFIWTPDTYVSVLGVNNILKYIKIGITIILAIYVAVQMDINFVRAPRYSKQQIKDYELWNKFFLHYAFLKTGSGSEKSQVLEVLRYLEDNDLKETLTEIYEENTSLKDAHNQIIEKYPYPQVKTFFAESEDALVRGADGNHLMQKTALNIDKYINDVANYEKEKVNSYKMSLILLITVVVLTIIVKLAFADTFIMFADSITGFLILVIYTVVLTKLFVKIKKAVNKPLLSFGGEDNE